MSAQLLDDDGNPINGATNQAKPQLMDDNGNVIGEHPHSGLTDFLSSLPEKSNKFLSEHPIINDLLFGAKKTPSGRDIVGPEPMHVPGVRAGFNYLADKIDNPQGEGGYGRGFAAGALQGFGNVASTLNPLPKIPEPVGRVDFIPGEETPITPKGTDFEGIKNRAVDAEIIPDFKSSNAPLKQLEPFNHDLPAEFAPVDSAVDVSKSEGIQTQTSPDELGYNNVLENQGKKELEPLAETDPDTIDTNNRIQAHKKASEIALGPSKSGTMPISDLSKLTANSVPKNAPPELLEQMKNGDIPSVTIKLGRNGNNPPEGVHIYGEDYGTGGNLEVVTGQESILAAAKQLGIKEIPVQFAGDIRPNIDPTTMHPYQQLYDKEGNLKSGETLPEGWTHVDENNSENGLQTTNEPEQALATVSNEHQVLTRPDTIRSMTGVEDGFLEPKFEEDIARNGGDGPIPEPGMAKPSNSKGIDNVGSYDSQFNSVNKIMDRFPSTQGISKALTDAQDIKPRWLYGKFREFADISKGLNLDQRKQLSQLINRGTNAGEELDVTNAVKNPGDNNYGPMSGISPDMIERANRAKSLLDDVHEFMVQMGVKSGTMGPNGAKTNLGYLSQYFPHMKRGPEGFAEQIKDIWTHYLGKENPFWKVLFDTGENPANEKVSDSVGDMYDKGTSTDPWSAFTKQRNNLMKPEDIEWDFNKVIPAYLESIAKVAFDGPAIEKAEALLQQNAESMSPRLKQLAENAILNYSGYDAKAALTQNWDNLYRSMAKRIADSLIALNPGVHLLHLGEVPTTVLSGLGPKYTAIGIKDFGLNIRKNFEDMARLGLIQDEVKPMSFKTTKEKVDSIMYFRSYIESIVKGIAYRGALAKGLDDGLAHPDAVREAIKVAKDLTLTVDKARQMQALTPEGKAGAAGPIVRLSGQFLGIPLKYVEQQEDYIKALVDNPKLIAAWQAVGLSILGAGTMYGAGKAVNEIPTKYTDHLKFVHIESPTNLLTGATMGPFADIMKRMVNDTALAAKAYQKGDMQQGKNYTMQSIMDVASLFVKGGTQIRKSLPDSISKPGSTGNKGKMRLRFSDKLKP